jgi:hypothetical protein
MRRLAIVGVLVLGSTAAVVTPGLATAQSTAEPQATAGPSTAAPTKAGAPQPTRAMPAASYIQAVRVADLFLAAWARRDVDAGLALMSSALLGAEHNDRVDLSGGLKQYMSGTSNPHHEAFEIGRGAPVGGDRFAFPVRLFELYLGEPTGTVCSDTLEVEREEGDWRIDRLPRNHNPD